MNSTCVEEKELVFHPAFQFMVVLCMISSVVTYIIMAIFLKKYARKVYWHLNVKILFNFNMFISFFLAASVMKNFIGMWMRMLTATENCSVVLQLKNCGITRWVFLVSFCLITLNHIAILVERFWATIRISKYEKSSGVLGCILVILISAIGILIVHLIMIPEDPEEFVPTCLSFSATKVGPNIYYLFTFQCITEILVLTAHRALLSINKSRCQKSASSNGSLTEKFQLNENLSVLKQMSPMIIICASVIGIYNIIVISIRPFRFLFTKNHYIIIMFSVFIIPYLPFLLTSVAFYTIKKQLKNQAEISKKNVEIDIIRNSNFTNNYYNWDAEYASKYSEPQSKKIGNNRVHAFK